jgi:hypothetical protein
MHIVPTLYLSCVVVFSVLRLVELHLFFHIPIGPCEGVSINLGQVTISIQRSALGLKHQHLQEAVVPKQAH